MEENRKLVFEWWRYEVSDMWRLRRINSTKNIERYRYIKWSCIKINKDWKKYMSTVLGSSRRWKRYLIHRLVAKAFLWLDINNPKMLVCHKDDNPENNCVYNLMLWDAKLNLSDASMKNRMSCKLSIDDIKLARDMFEMKCSNKHIAEKLNVSWWSISKLKYNDIRWISCW